MLHSTPPSHTSTRPSPISQPTPPPRMPSVRTHQPTAHSPQGLLEQIKMKSSSWPSSRASPFASSPKMESSNSERVSIGLQATWLCEAHECSMISTISKPCRLNAFCCANQLACLLRCLPPTGILFALAPAVDQGNRVLLVEASTGIRAAKVPPQVCVSRPCVSGI